MNRQIYCGVSISATMAKLFGKTLVILTVLSGLLGSEAAMAEDPSIIEGLTPLSDPAASVEVPYQNIGTEPVLNNTPASAEKTDPMARVTSVSSLRDVQPTDWAFGALQSLVERYGCIEGYPDGTYRGNRAMTRYEFAAGLNSCLNRIQELIASLPQGIGKEDLASLQKLQEEFAAELASLRGRIDSLEARTARIENQQFSTTTKLSGLVMTYFGDVFGENAGPANNATYAHHTYLTLLTSFTGKDSLIVGLEASNLKTFNTATQFPTTDSIGTTNEARLAITGAEVYGFGDSDIGLSQLQYRLPINDKVAISFDAFASNRILSAPITGLNSLSSGPVSYFGKTAPLLYPVNQQTGIGLQWQIAPWFSMDFSLGRDFKTEDPGTGLFNAGYSASVRPVINLGRFRFSGSYMNSYSPAFGIDTFSGSNASRVVGAGPVIANTLFAGAFYRFSQSFEFGGAIAYSKARALGQGTKGDAEVWQFDADFVFYDVGKKGNTAGIIIGMQPRLTGTSNGALASAIGLEPGQRSDRDVGFHVEAFYNYQVSDNITITPGVFWLTAPNHDDRNPDVIVGVVRTSFSF
uniref:iron uptake porin n=2 Tax=Argonema antarcticum TaxID=2942763 RepID=UPI0030D7C55F